MSGEWNIPRISAQFKYTAAIGVQNVSFVLIVFHVFLLSLSALSSVSVLVLFSKYHVISSIVKATLLDKNVCRSCLMSIYRLFTLGVQANSKGLLKALYISCTLFYNNKSLYTTYTVPYNSIAPSMSHTQCRTTARLPLYIIHSVLQQQGSLCISCNNKTHAVSHALYPSAARHHALCPPLCPPVAMLPMCLLHCTHHQQGSIYISCTVSSPLSISSNAPYVSHALYPLAARSPLYIMHCVLPSVLQ